MADPATVLAKRKRDDEPSSETAVNSPANNASTSTSDPSAPRKKNKKHKKKHDPAPLPASAGITDGVLEGFNFDSFANSVWEASTVGKAAVEMANKIIDENNAAAEKEKEKEKVVERGPDGQDLSLLSKKERKKILKKMMKAEQKREKKKQEEKKDTSESKPAEASTPAKAIEAPAPTKPIEVTTPAKALDASAPAKTFSVPTPTTTATTAATTTAETTPKSVATPATPASAVEKKKKNHVSFATPLPATPKFTPLISSITPASTKKVHVPTPHPKAAMKLLESSSSDSSASPAPAAPPKSANEKPPKKSSLKEKSATKEKAVAKEITKPKEKPALKEKPSINGKKAETKAVDNKKDKNWDASLAIRDSLTKSFGVSKSPPAPSPPDNSKKPTQKAQKKETNPKPISTSANPEIDSDDMSFLSSSSSSASQAEDTFGTLKLPSHRHSSLSSEDEEEPEKTYASLLEASLLEAQLQPDLEVSSQEAPSQEIPAPRKRGRPPTGKAKAEPKLVDIHRLDWVKDPKQLEEKMNSQDRIEREVAISWTLNEGLRKRLSVGVDKSAEANGKQQDKKVEKKSDKKEKGPLAPIVDGNNKVTKAAAVKSVVAKKKATPVKKDAKVSASKKKAENVNGAKA